MMIIYWIVAAGYKLDWYSTVTHTHTVKYGQVYRVYIRLHSEDPPQRQKLLIILDYPQLRYIFAKLAL